MFLIIICQFENCRQTDQQIDMHRILIGKGIFQSAAYLEEAAKIKRSEGQSANYWELHSSFATNKENFF